MGRGLTLLLTLGCCASACAPETNSRPLGSGGGTFDASGDSPGQGGAGASGSDATVDLKQPGDATFNADAACAVASEAGEVVFLPVDIIWMVDNSVSMAPAIDEVTAGLNDFVDLIASKSLDYKVIMLSLRSQTNPTEVGGDTRYGVCIPPPLAGDASCGNGPRFFHSSIDVRSTQPLEQFLGTLGQTPGYQPADSRGGEPWKDELRPNATRTIVVVSDDNARLGASQFEAFAGGSNPFNSTTLPPGILDPSWNGLFDGYLFSALYGWGSESDPGATCTYPGGGSPPASGLTYTELVQKTGGVRAKICDGSAAWGPFFDAVAQEVASASKIRCEIEIPEPSMGTVDPQLVNVSVDGDGSTTTLLKVGGAADCDQDGGWYYDDDIDPAHVILCPTSCANAQDLATNGDGVEIEVHFGCATLVK